VLFLFAALAAGSGTVAGSHGAGQANFTVEPLGDRSPGATEVRYGRRVVGQAGADLETLTRTNAIFEEGSWADCEPTDGETFGVDRSNTYSGYEVDETLQNNIKSFSAGEDELVIEFDGEGDIGASTYLDDGDEVVSVAGCIDNPDEAGWYQISGSTTGVTAGGERVTFRSVSHHFHVCDCDSEAAARQQLGPPPSEPQVTAAVTPTSPVDTATGTATETPDRMGTATRTRTAATPTMTPRDRTLFATAEASTVEGVSTESTDSWDDAVCRTPTRNAGGGFGPVAALSGLLAAMFVAVRRR